MNKPLLESDFITSIPTLMTKREKLRHLAHLIRKYPDNIVIFSNIEYLTDRELGDLWHPFSAFAIAARDKTLQDAGLKGESALDAKRFFELTTDELHEFSCDCGGYLTNAQMARRIERLAK